MTPDAFWHGRSVLVTGATGFLGSHLVQALVDRAARVVVLRRDRRPVTPVNGPWMDAVAVVEGDVTDSTLIRRVLEEFSVATVLHVAAQTQVGAARRQPALTFESNVRGTWGVLDAVRDAPWVQQVVIASSDKAYGVQAVLPYDESMPLLAVEPYDASKACAEMLAMSYANSYGSPVAITRCANFYGPGDRNWGRIVPGTLRSVLRGERPVVRSDGSLVRDYLFVKDGVSAYLTLAEALARDPGLVGQAFNFSAEQPLSVLEMIDAIQAAAGTSLDPVIENTAVGEIPSQHLSARKAREVLGWAPEYSLERGLEETVAYYRQVVAGDQPVSG